MNSTETPLQRSSRLRRSIEELANDTHRIAFTEQHYPRGNAFRASCLCGWTVQRFIHPLMLQHADAHMVMFVS